MSIEESAPLTGEALRQYLRQEVQRLRSLADVRSRFTLSTSDTGMAALRYFGKHLPATAQAALEFLTEGETTGAFTGLGFTSRELQLTLEATVDAHHVELALQGLAQDAHQVTLDRRARLAEMTLRLVQSQRALLGSPATAPALKTQLREAGGQLTLELEALHQGRQRSRASSGALREAKDAIARVTRENQEHTAQATLREAQKDLQLRLLAGEALRPSDLVQTPPSEEPMPSRSRRRGR